MKQARACNLHAMASFVAGEGSFAIEGSVSDAIEGSVSDKASVPCIVSGQGSFSLDGSVPRKASVERAFPGKAKASVTLAVPDKAKASVALAVPGKAKASVALDDPGEASVERADPGKASVALAVPGKQQASVGVKDPGSGFGTGSSSREGSVPAPLDGVILVQGKDSGKEDDGKVSVPVEMQYPWIIQRFRLRRLLSFLASTRFYDAYVAMQSNVSLVLDLEYLQGYLEACLWDDARDYILAILPHHLMGVDVSTLVDFLRFLKFTHAIATGHRLAPEWIAMFERSARDPVVIRDANHAKLVRTVLSMRSQQARPSVDWNVVGEKAAKIVRDFISQSPEFSEYLRLPRRSSNIHNVVNVLPHGFRCRRTRCMKKSGRVSASVIAKYFLPKGTVHPGQRSGCSGLVTDPSAWLQAAIDEALRAGMSATLYQAHPIVHAYDEGMDRKRSSSSVSQDLDDGSNLKRPRTAETWSSWISIGGKRATYEINMKSGGDKQAT